MQPNPDDHEHLWVLLNKLDDAEQLNDALLDGLRRDDIWHGDDAPGPSTYIAAPVPSQSNGVPRSRSSMTLTSRGPG